MSEKETTYRRLTENDVDLMRKMNEMFAEAFEDPHTHLSKKPSDPYLQSLLEKNHFIALVALQGSEVAGGIIAYNLEKYEQERGEVYIYDLAVAKKFRRNKIATTLIQELKPIAKSMGAWAIFVQADRVDKPAVALYESLGVREEPLHFDIYLNDQSQG